MSMSLDGFVAGPDQSVKDPLGVGGERLHDWIVPLAVFREMHGEDGSGARSTRAPPWFEAGGRTSAPSSWVGTCSAVGPVRGGGLARLVG